MTFKEIQELIKMINKYELDEFQLKEGEFEISIKTSFGSADTIQQIITQAPAPVVAAAPVQVAAPIHAVAIASPPSPVVVAESDSSDLIEVKSPIVGTFYRSQSPENPAYVKVGDSIAVGDTVCIVEAMKLFNEIESEVSGKIVKVLVEDASPIEYDQALFLVDPKG